MTSRLLISRAKIKTFFPARWGLEGIALFEAAKGSVVLFAGFGLLTFIHRDLQNFGERVIHDLHLNPAHHYPRIFLEFLAKVNDNNIRWLAFGAFVYAVVRFSEAYGLWHAKAWAEWLAILSGGIYLPVEFYELAKGFTWLKLTITMGNILVVLYLLWLRWGHGPVPLRVEDKRVTHDDHSEHNDHHQ